MNKNLVDKILASVDSLTKQNSKTFRLNSDIDFLINGKLVKGKTKSNLIPAKYPDTGVYIDVLANGKMYLCKRNQNENNFFAIIN